MSGAYSMYGERRGLYRVLVGKTGGKRPLGRPQKRWVEVEWGSWTWLVWLGIGTGGEHLAT